MAIGTALSVVEGFPEPGELATFAPTCFFDPTLESAADSAALYMAYASASFATDAAEPADVTILTAFSTDDCRWCDSMVANVRDYAMRNIRVTGWELSDPERGELRYGWIDDDSVVVELPTHVSAIRFWNTDGTLINDQPAFDVLFRLQLRFLEGAWRVEGIDEQEL